MNRARWIRLAAQLLLINAVLAVPGSLAYIIAAIMAFDAPGSTKDPMAWLGALLFLATPLVVVADAAAALMAYRTRSARWLSLAAGLFVGWCLVFWLIAKLPPWMAFPGPMILMAYFDA